MIFCWRPGPFSGDCSYSEMHKAGTSKTYCNTFVIKFPLFLHMCTKFQADRAVPYEVILVLKISLCLKHPVHGKEYGDLNKVTF